MQNQIENGKSFKTFIAFWLTQSVSQLGSAMTSYALVLWVYAQTGAALSVSLLTLCTYVPYILVSVFAGGFVDAHFKKRIMLACDGVAFLCTVSIAAALLTGRLTVGHILVVNTIVGFMNAFQQPAFAVVSGMLVPQDKLTRMAGMQSISGSLVGIFTPIFAAFLMSFFGIGAVLVVDGVSFLLAAGALAFFIRVPERAQDLKQAEKNNPFAGLRDGIRFLRGDRVVLTMVLVLAVMNFFSRISYENILSPMILSRSGSQRVMGLVSGVMGAAGVVGGVIAAKIPAPKRPAARICGMGLASFLLGDLLMATGRTPMMWLLAAVGGNLPIPILDSGYQYLFYTRVPREIQGRVFAVRNLIQYASIPAGLLLGGTLADYVFEPIMAGGSGLAQALGCIVGTGAGSGMAAMFLMTGTLGILTCALGYFSMKKALK